MAVLRMGLPGLESALKYVFSYMRGEEIRSLPFYLVSNSVIVPRVSGSIDSIRDVLFGGNLPIKKKKIITIDDLIGFELVKPDSYFIVKVYASTGDLFAVHSFISYPKFDRTIGYFHEGGLTASCKEYDSITKDLPLDISNSEDDRIVDIKYTIFRVVSAMIPAANLLYFLYNLDKDVKVFISELSRTPKDEEKIRDIAEIVRGAGDNFQEAVVNLGIMSRYIYG